MAIRISDNFMTLEVSGTVLATARFSQDAAAVGNGAWIIIFAIAADAGDREAHAREVEQFGRGLLEGSYGRLNREAIAAREMHAAQRLRAIERAYQMAIDHDAAISYDPSAAIRLTDHIAEREMELE